jgi:ADP-ribose pyrophosphatase
MLTKWKRNNTKVVYQNHWWTYKLDEFEIPGKVSGEYHYAHTNGSSMIIPITDEGKIILVKQYRYLNDKESIEFPCGSVKDRKTHLETAHLELQEETGHCTDSMELIGEFNPCNGITDEICKVFIAEKLRQSIAKPDDTEEIELLYCTSDEVNAMIRNNIIWDGMTLASWMIYFKKL